MSDIIKEWGLKLICTKIKLAGSPMEFFKQTQIKHWSIVDGVSRCSKVYNDVLWMRLFEMEEGLKLPNGCRMVVFVPFLSKVKYYRYRSLIPKYEGQDVLNKPWMIESFSV